MASSKALIMAAYNQPPEKRLGKTILVESTKKVVMGLWFIVTRRQNNRFLSRLAVSHMLSFIQLLFSIKNMNKTLFLIQKVTDKILPRDWSRLSVTSIATMAACSGRPQLTGQPVFVLVRCLWE